MPVGSCDNWNYNSSNPVVYVGGNWNQNGNPCLHVGGNYNQNRNHGLFYVNYNSATNANANIGCRSMKLS